MKRKWIILLVIIGTLAAVGGAFAWSGSRQQAQAQSDLQTVAAEKGSLQATVGASGMVRSNQSAQLAWQTSGTVGDVRVAVGQPVKIGDELASLNASLLPQNIILAQADLVDARKSLNDLMNSKLQQANALQAVEDAQQALEDSRTSDTGMAQAQQAVADAQKAMEQAETNLRSAQSTANQSYINEAEANVTILKDQLDRAREKYLPYANKPEDNLTRARLLSTYAAAQQQYDAAVRELNSLQGTAGSTDLALRESELAQARAGLADAQREWERVKDGPSEAELATLEAKLADAQREWERVKDGPAAEDVQAAEARLAAAEATLNQARIVAPFGGEITRVVSKVGDQVNAGTVAFRLDDLSRLLVDVAVSEVDINQVEVGQDAVLTFDSILGKEYEGRVVEVSSVGETEAGVVNFTVTVEIIAADEQVKPGMTAGVTIVVSKLEDVLLVPNRAVRVEDGQRVVYVLRNGVAVPVKIILGKTSDTSSEVVGGDLQVGDLVVLNPPVQIQMGPGANGGQNGMFGGG